ncbi:hypothetical protein KAT24_01615 [Candidatus Pacearchaeota archaeon]|nr:hypothetical protein [Candidatus Pacearchaeota archaeon]
MNNRGALAISQIIILVIGIIAIACIIGNIGFVGALPPHSGPVTFPRVLPTQAPHSGPATFAMEGTKFATKASKAAESTAATGFGKSFAESFLNSFFQGGGASSLGSYLGYITGTLAVAAATVAAVYAITKALGASDRNTLVITVAAGITAGTMTVGSGILALAGLGPPGWGVALVIVLAAAVWAAFTFQLYSQEIFTFQPTAWQPPDGGENCEDCNELRYGCSEYQCHTFGKACILENEGTDYEACIWNDPRDITPPSMTAMESVLPDETYEYRESYIVLPPERGVQIFYEPDEDGCVPVFSSVVLGVNTSEPAECKIDLKRRPEFDEMISYMNEGNALTYEHTLTLPNSATPSAEAMTEAGWNVENGRQHEYYIRCKDANGNVAPMNFIIEFCVTDTPDTQEPIVLGTNFLPEAYISYDQKTAPLEVYTNKPADCKWDHEDLDYEDMTYDMKDCSQEAQNYFYAFTYGCRGELEGLANNIDNKFYIRCKDKPWWSEGDDGQRYANRDSYELILKGTMPLVINSIKVNGQEENIVVRDSTESVKVTIEVETFAGAEEGKARCKYKTGGVSYEFYNDGNPEYIYKNTQKLWLPEGNDYEYTIGCRDKGNNYVEETISFEVETDINPPLVVRAYYSGGDLRIITNEPAKCEYDTKYVSYPCDYPFGEGISISSSDGLTHSMTWNTNNNLYIKCKDLEYGSPPVGCSIILRPFEFF